MNCLNALEICILKTVPFWFHICHLWSSLRLSVENDESRILQNSFISLHILERSNCHTSPSPPQSEDKFLHLWGAPDRVFCIWDEWKAITGQTYCVFILKALCYFLFHVCKSVYICIRTHMHIHTWICIT